jgi:multidrug efflux pump subunit AcrB
VAEVYAADDSTRLAAAMAVKQVFERTAGVVDVDWTVEAPQQKRTFRVDRARAAESGASVEQITQTLYLALSGVSTGIAGSPTAKEAVNIVPRLPLERRASVEALLSMLRPRSRPATAGPPDGARGRREDACPKDRVRRSTSRACGAKSRVRCTRSST